MSDTQTVLPMASLTSCRGLYLPYLRNGPGIDEETLCIENDYAKITIRSGATDRIKMVDGKPTKVPAPKPNQSTAAIIESILKNRVAALRHSDGAIEVQFTPYAVLRDISSQVDENGNVVPRAITNYSWLYCKLKDLLLLVADVRLKSGGGMSEAAIIRSVQYPGDEDGGLPAERGLKFRKEGAARYWSITFSMNYSKLFLGETGVLYPSLMPVLNTMTGESAAIARYCLSNNFVKESARSILLALGMKRGKDRVEQQRLQRVRNDQRLLERCGITLSGTGQNLFVSYDKKLFDPKGMIVRFTAGIKAHVMPAAQALPALVVLDAVIDQDIPAPAPAASSPALLPRPAGLPASLLKFRKAA